MENFIFGAVSLVEFEREFVTFLKEEAITDVFQGQQQPSGIPLHSYYYDMSLFHPLLR